MDGINMFAKTKNLKGIDDSDRNNKKYIVRILE